MDDSWLSKNIRPLIMLIAFITLSLIMLLSITPEDWLLKTYSGWVASMITFYFVGREVIKAINRRK